MSRTQLSTLRCSAEVVVLEISKRALCVWGLGPLEGKTKPSRFLSRQSLVFPVYVGLLKKKRVAVSHSNRLTCEQKK
ncbi:hypothetical protein X975_13694, partial [Stegodyphus mimosarum]